jgi:hypothetical protein
MSLHPDIERVALLDWKLYPMCSTSKAGAFKGASDAATSDLATLEQLTAQYPGCGWRVKCGPSGLFILDVDRPGTHHADGFSALAGLVAKHGPLPERPMTKTGGSGGAALFFKHEGQHLRGQSGCPAPGLDPHRGSQAIVIPPSRHPVTGGAYTWRVAPWEVAPPPIPKWLAKMLTPPPEPKTREFVPTTEKARVVVIEAMHHVECAPSGAANDTLNRAAFRLGVWCASGTLHMSECTEALQAAAQRRAIPLPEARATIKSGLIAGQRRGALAHVG